MIYTTLNKIGEATDKELAAARAAARVADWAAAQDAQDADWVADWVEQELEFRRRTPMTDKPRVNVGTPGHIDWSDQQYITQEDVCINLLLRSDKPLKCPLKEENKQLRAQVEELSKYPESAVKYLALPTITSELVDMFYPWLMSENTESGYTWNQAAVDFACAIKESLYGKLKEKQGVGK